MSLTRFGDLDGAAVMEATLTSSAGIEVRVLSYGAVVRSWRVPGRDGVPRDVTLGFDDFAAYPVWSRSFGIIAGRIANRVRDGRFTLDGRTYQLDRNKGPHHIHGGSRGFGKRLWSLEADDTTARLTLTSPDGEMGYPGHVKATVEIALDGHTLTFEMTAVPDRTTPIALAQHSYYALGGPVGEYRLFVAADRTTVTDSLSVTTGEIRPVAGTALDFNTARPIGDMTLDDNFCLVPHPDGAPAATLTGRDMQLTLVTERPGLQVYTASDVPEIPVPGLGGARYGPRCAVALEAQDWPGAVNHANFPSILHTPDRPYRQTTAVTIAPT